MLPKRISKELKVNETTVEPFRDGRLLGAYVHTQLTSDLRNLLTGRAVDALVALEGTGGTVKEVNTALEAGRPVVFLKSLEVLLRDLSSNDDSLMLEADTAQDAVAQALSALDLDGASPGLSGAFPATFEHYHDETTYPRLKTEYEQTLRGFWA
jgi:hypothetical protein